MHSDFVAMITPVVWCSLLPFLRQKGGLIVAIGLFSGRYTDHYLQILFHFICLASSFNDTFSHIRHPGWCVFSDVLHFHTAGYILQLSFCFLDRLHHFSSTCCQIGNSLSYKLLHAGINISTVKCLHHLHKRNFAATTS